MSIFSDAIEFFTPANAPSESVSMESAQRRDATNLYSCSACERTYIVSASTELHACPQCDGPVERTPSFAELGIDQRPRHHS